MNGVGEAGPEAVFYFEKICFARNCDRILSSTSVSSRVQTIQPVNNHEFNFTIDGNADEVTMKQTTQQIIDSITKIQNDNVLRFGVKQRVFLLFFSIKKDVKND